MLKIFIDANKRNYKIVTLLKTDGNLSATLAKKEGDIDIVTEIQNIMEEQNMTLQQVDSFDFANGSGSFTGIKTSAAIANVLQWALKGTPIGELTVPEYGAEPSITPQPKIDSN